MLTHYWRCHYPISVLQKKTLGGARLAVFGKGNFVEKVIFL